MIDTTRLSLQIIAILMIVGFFILLFNKLQDYSSDSESDKASLPNKELMPELKSSVTVATTSDGNPQELLKSDDRKETKLLILAIIVTVLLVGSLCLLPYIMLQYTDKHPYFTFVTYLCYGLGAIFVGLVLFSKIGRGIIYPLLFVCLLTPALVLISEYLKGYNFTWLFVLIVCAVVGRIAFSVYNLRGQVKLGLNEDSNEKK